MHRRKGLTVVEMAVIIGLAVVTIGVFVPMLGKARQTAQSIQCQSRVRQMGVAMAVYLGAHNVFPPERWPAGNSGNKDTYWFELLGGGLGGAIEEGCPCAAAWQAGRDFSYGYNYKYLGSSRRSPRGRTSPFDCFPVTQVAAPALTIAFGDSDGTGWTKVYIDGASDPEVRGHQGYLLDPTFIPQRSLSAADDPGAGEAGPYAWGWWRSYLSDRHGGMANVGFVDGHAALVLPARAYRDNSLWNGLGCEDPTRDSHVPFRFCQSVSDRFRYNLEPNAYSSRARGTGPAMALTIP